MYTNTVLGGRENVSCFREVSVIQGCSFREVPVYTYSLYVILLQYELGHIVYTGVRYTTAQSAHEQTNSTTSTAVPCI